MTWNEFREYVALCAIGLATAAAVFLVAYAAVVVTGAVIGGTSGAFVWAFRAVAGACR